MRAIYFMHFRDGSDEMLDPEGKEFANLDELRTSALSNARELRAADIRGGILDLRFRIDAEDEEGTLVYRLPFENALSIIAAA